STDTFSESNLSQKKKVAGYAKPCEFYLFTPKFNNKNYRDTRSTLFWAPQVRTDEVFGLATISFYAADLITTYRIVVEGISDLGEPVRGVFYIDIKE
ncbi:MAG: hypothetical protein JNL53_08160, partial [Cyclobacteriaceae bacterium]|nr:hypothetical protein [Cyclobacteriaceae bacterium]